MNRNIMQNYEIEPALRADPALGPRVEEAKPVLEDALGDSAHVATAKWRRKEDAGRSYAVLNLSDFTYPKGVEAKLTPEDLNDHRYLRRRLYDLWGDLLHAHLEKSVKELKAMFPEGAFP